MKKQSGIPREEFARAMMGLVAEKSNDPKKRKAAKEFLEYLDKEKEKQNENVSKNQ